MKVISCGLLCIFLLGVTHTGRAGLNSQDVGQAKAKQLWDQVIAAKGGRERLYAVNSLVASTRAKNLHPTKDFTGHHFESLLVLPDKWWFRADERGFGLSIWTYDFGRQVGEEVWGAAPGVSTFRPASGPGKPAHGSPEEKNDARYRFVREQFIHEQLIYLMETKWLQPTLLRAGTARLKGKEVDVVEVSYGKERFEFYVDRKSHLPMKVLIKTELEHTQGEFVDSFTLGDYVEVQGIQFPRVVSRGDAESETTYQVNVAYDGGIFERPPSVGMGAEAWKAKK